jgi:hypothetical protein
MRALVDINTALKGTRRRSHEIYGEDGGTGKRA